MILQRIKLTQNLHFSTSTTNDSKTTNNILLQSLESVLPPPFTLILFTLLSLLPPFPLLLLLLLLSQSLYAPLFATKVLICMGFNVTRYPPVPLSSRILDSSNSLTSRIFPPISDPSFALHFNLVVVALALLAPSVISTKLSNFKAWKTVARSTLTGSDNTASSPFSK